MYQWRRVYRKYSRLHSTLQLCTHSNPTNEWNRGRNGRISSARRKMATESASERESVAWVGEQEWHCHSRRSVCLLPRKRSNETQASERLCTQLNWNKVNWTLREEKALNPPENRSLNPGEWGQQTALSLSHGLLF